ncbi:hypothetical protein ACTJIJ_22875 [Niabella sp. 22666]|uniref:hypothetical protein n=1 Tax=Niabella sp. 22666 TaxID=3453954 RepID=UPI003F876E35
MQISDKSKAAYEAAAKKLNRSAVIPDFSMLPEDVALYMTAVLMLTTIIEAEKDGKVYDITNHDEWKYQPIHEAEEGYEAGSSGGGFSFVACVHAHAFSDVGARLSSNSYEECKANAQEYPDLWEIFTLNVR